MNPRRLFLKLLIGSVGISAAIAIGVLLFGNFGEFEVRVLMTTLTITVTSICGLACGAYLETGREKYLPLTGIILSIAWAAMSFLIVWDVLDESEVFVKSFVTVSLIAASCTHLSLLLLARLDQRFKWTRIAAVVCIGLFVAIVLFLLWAEPQGDSDIVYRVLGTLGILIASVTVLTPILHKLSSTEEDLDAIDKEIADLETRLEILRTKKREIVGSSRT